MNHSHEPTNPLIEFLRRRWLLVAAAAVVTAGGAWLYAGRTSTSTYSASATMLYNRSQLGAPHYQQPEIQTIVGLFRARTVLESLAREFQLPPDLKPLSQSITAEALFNSNSIQLTMQGNDAKRTQAELDRLMQLVIDQAGALRRTAVTHILEGLEKRRVEAGLAADRAFADLHQFNVANRIVASVDDDLERLNDDVAAVERLAETDRPTTLDPEEALQRRRGALLERLNHERESIGRNSALELKQNEYDRAKRLHDKRYISDGEFRRVEAEYRALAAQNDDALKSWNDRIAQLDRELAQRIDPTAGSNATAAGSTSSTTTADTTYAALAARLKGFLEQRRAEVERLNTLRAEAAKLEQAVTAAQDEVRRVSTSIASYDELRDAPYYDLAVVQPAAPALDPVASNKKKVFVGAWLAALCLFVAPLFVWDYAAARRASPVVQQTNKNGNSMLASVDDFSGGGAAARREVIRTLALRLQQIPSQRGVVAALNSLNDVAAPMQAAVETAECLQRRGEHVLLVDLTGGTPASAELTALSMAKEPGELDVVEEWIAAPGSQRASYGSAAVAERVASVHRATTVVAPGFTDLLTDPRLTTADVVRSAVAFDVVMFGETPLPEEAFAGRRLTALLDEWRSQYGVVLLLGPGVEHGVDLELLAARVDALAFVAEGGASPTAAAERTMASLAALRAPVLGTVRL